MTLGSDPDTIPTDREGLCRADPVGRPRQSAKDSLATFVESLWGQTPQGRLTGRYLYYKKREAAFMRLLSLFTCQQRTSWFSIRGEKRRPPREGCGTRRLPAEHLSLRGECPADSSLSHARLSMVRQRAYPRSFGSPVSLVTTGQLTHQVDQTT